MATGVDFVGTNITMLPPKGQEDEVGKIDAFRNQRCCVTCWLLSDEEKAEVARTGRVYLSIFGNGGMSPAFVGSESVVRQHIEPYGGSFPEQVEN